MKYLKLFETYNMDLSSYCFDYWDVDAEYLFELVQHEVEDNSLKMMRFNFDIEGKNEETLLIYDSKFGLSQTGPMSKARTYYALGYSTKNLWSKFFEEIRRVEEEHWWPFPSDTIFKTSVYFEDKSWMGGMKPNKYFPLIQLGFDRSSIIEDGNIGDWEDHFSSLFNKVNIPYYFDGDSAYIESNMIYYTLYHI